MNADNNTEMLTCTVIWNHANTPCTSSLYCSIVIIQLAYEVCKHFHGEILLCDWRVIRLFACPPTSWSVLSTHMKNHYPIPTHVDCLAAVDRKFVDSDPVQTSLMQNLRHILKRFGRTDDSTGVTAILICDTDNAILDTPVTFRYINWRLLSSFIAWEMQYYHSHGSESDSAGRGVTWILPT